jgi:hypothetical protein
MSIVSNRAGASARARSLQIATHRTRWFVVPSMAALAAGTAGGDALLGAPGAVVGCSAVTLGGVFLARRAWRGSEAARWLQGAAGEARTARAVKKLRKRGWHLFNDLAVPRSRANIDHLWVPPSGELVVVGDTKAWHAKGAKVRLYGDRLMYGKWDQSRCVETIRWETSKVVESLRVRAFSVLVVDGAKVDAKHHPGGWIEVDPTFYVVEQDQLFEFLAGVKGHLNKHAVKEIVSDVHRLLPAYRR